LPDGEPQKKPKAQSTGKATGSTADGMNDRVSNSSAMTESSAVEIEIATRRLMAALDALESAVERRRDADRDENELAARIQALGADRSRLADELDGALMKSRKLERTNREISDRLDSAIVTIRSVLDTGEDG
jgi:chromosome segregation ATPase